MDSQIRSNKYLLNHEYFDKIDTENKAYILGFLYADGNVSNDMYYINIDISENDIDILDNISSEIYKKKPKYIKRIISDKSYVRLTISSKHMCESLARSGCVPNKTFKIDKIPDIPHELIRHFIRGYFDGDGTVSIKKKNSLFVSIIGNLQFLEQVSEYLKESDIESRIYKYNGYYYLRIISLRNLYYFYNLIYKDINSFYLHRKKYKLDLSHDDMYRNKDKVKSSNTIGVSYDKSRCKWRVIYKRKYYGRYDTEKEAINKVMEVIENEKTCNSSKN